METTVARSAGVRRRDQRVVGHIRWGLGGNEDDFGFYSK
jgi:hypothetical protein